MFLILFLFLSISLPAENYYDQGKQFAETYQRNLTEEFQEKKKLLRKELSSLHFSKNKDLEKTVKEKCKVSPHLESTPQTNLYVFVSFSLPEETWLDLSNNVQKVGGILVLRGLPENSFKELSSKIYSLRQKGMQATVQIDPELFIKYEVDKVPCFVTLDENNFNKLSGNVSLFFALEKMETESSKQLRKIL